VKTIGFIFVIGIPYEQEGFLLTTMITILILLIFLEAVTFLFLKLMLSENAFKQIFKILRYIFLVSLIITSFSISTNDPLGFLDELDWFEGESISKQRIDAQSQIINRAEAFTYNDDTMLVVTTPHQTKLRGSAYNYYTSSDWRISTAFRDDVVDYQLELLKRIDLLNQYNIPYEEYNLQIIHKVYSQLMYSTSNSYIDVPESISSSTARFYKSKSELEKEFEYTVNAINIDYKTTEFRGFITSLDVDNTQKEYLQLPSEFNEDIRLLTLDITKDADSVYEKVLAVEEYLARNHEYNKKPIQKPNYYDYVDFFLFESMEGFCNNYASRMELMVR